METLTISARRYINKNFIIRVYPDSLNTHKNYIVGLPGLLKQLEDERLFRKVLEKVMESPNDKEEFKFRRGLRKGDRPGLRVTFASR